MPDVILFRDDVNVSAPMTLAVTVDGSASHGEDGAAITYLWEIVEAPDKAAEATGPTTLATLQDATASMARVNFVGRKRISGARAPLSAAGLYSFRLTVTDGTATASTTVRLKAQDPLFLLPVADAGLSRSYGVQFLLGTGIAATIPDPAPGSRGTLQGFIRLDGRESADPQRLPLSYRWSVLSVPAGSQLSALSNASTPFPFFVPDREGSYQFGLSVANGIAIGETDAVTILIRSSNEPPTASAHSEDLVRVRRSTFFLPVLAFRSGDRVVLDGSESSDPDTADRSTLTYSWRQTAGSPVSLEPGTTGDTISFTSVSVGRLAFELTVTDTKGASSTDVVEVAVLPAGTAPIERAIPVLSLV
ncbi:MAG: peptidase-like protein, partial [bacterium]